MENKQHVEAISKPIETIDYATFSHEISNEDQDVVAIASTLTCCEDDIDDDIDSRFDLGLSFDWSRSHFCNDSNKLPCQTINEASEWLFEKSKITKKTQ